jgi:DNA integrity scanning protein DisA with diadenylate cyclase activity
MVLDIRFIDAIDIVLVAIIFFQLYKLIRGTAALSIFIGIFIIYMFWLLVKALNMELIGALMGQVIGVGVIALIIVFQQEVRRFLLVIGNRYMNRRRFSFGKIFSTVEEETGSPKEAEEIVRATESMASKKTGALIVLGRKSSLDIYSEGGERIDAIISAELLETIFFKNSPLHDGAVLIEDAGISPTLLFPQREFAHFQVRDGGKFVFDLSPVPILLPPVIETACRDDAHGHDEENQ